MGPFLDLIVDPGWRESQTEEKLFTETVTEPTDSTPEQGNQNPAWTSLLPIALIVLVAAIAIVISRRRQ